jgi:hypothetical protein
MPFRYREVFTGTNIPTGEGRTLKPGETFYGQKRIISGPAERYIERVRVPRLDSDETVLHIDLIHPFRRGGFEEREEFGVGGFKTRYPGGYRMHLVTETTDVIIEGE